MAGVCVQSVSPPECPVDKVLCPPPRVTEHHGDVMMLYDLVLRLNVY